MLGLAGSCDCFDLNNACMGFLSAFDVAARSVATGCGPVAIVASEMGSRYITPDDPRPFLVCADAAAAAVLTTGRDGEGVLAAWMRNDGTIQGEVRLDHPGLTGRRETIRFGAPNATFSEIAVRIVRRTAAAVAEQAGVALDAIEWVVPHQPNGSLLATMLDALAIDPGRVVPIVQDVGSVGAASIPICLDRLLRTRPVRPGDRILMLGIGAGAAYGAILYQVGA
jgi:3-oxoacyl-[acyl-carrier-protein] synthase III